MVFAVNITINDDSNMVLWAGLITYGILFHTKRPAYTPGLLEMFCTRQTMIDESRDDESD